MKGLYDCTDMCVGGYCTMMPNMFGCAYKSNVAWLPTSMLTLKPLQCVLRSAMARGFPRSLTRKSAFFLPPMLNNVDYCIRCFLLLTDVK